MTGGVSGGGATTGPVATVCATCVNTTSHGSTADSSANETEGARVHDRRGVTTGNKSPVGGERVQTVACRTDGRMVSRGI
jgi:hypothetical protein